MADGGQALHGHVHLARGCLLLVVAETDDDGVIAHRHAGGHQQAHAGAVASHAGSAETGQADAGHGGRTQDGGIHDAIDVGSAQHGVAAIAHGQGQAGGAAGDDLVHHGAATNIQRRGRIARRHAAAGKVGAVVVRVNTAAIRAQDSHAIRRRGRDAALKTVGRAEADQVDDGSARWSRSHLCRLAIAQQYFTRRARHGQGARGVRRGQVLRAACAFGLLHQQILASLQIDGRQGRHGPARSTGRAVLHAPVAQVNGAAATIENLNEIVAVQRAVVAATAIYLADDDIGSGQGHGWQGQAGQHGGHDGQAQRRAQWGKRGVHEDPGR